jgi:hypothetical protein
MFCHFSIRENPYQCLEAQQLEIVALHRELLAVVQQQNAELRVQEDEYSAFIDQCRVKDERIAEAKKQGTYVRLQN